MALLVYDHGVPWQGWSGMSDRIWVVLPALIDRDALVTDVCVAVFIGDLCTRKGTQESGRAVIDRIGIAICHRPFRQMKGGYRSWRRLACRAFRTAGLFGCAVPLPPVFGGLV